MKIAVATDDRVNVTGHVGRCREFIIFETDDQKIINKEFRENSFTHHGKGNQHQHGEGHHHGHGALVEGLKDCSCLISQGGGWRLIDDLKANNIAPIFTSVLNAEEAVQKFIKGELKSEDDLSCHAH